MTGPAFAPPLADVVTDALSGVAKVLEIPAHVGMLVLLLLLALEVGRGLTETWRRHRPGRLRLYDVVTRAFHDPRHARELARLAPSPLAEQAVLQMATAVGTGRPDGVEHALADYELGVQRRLDRTRMLVRSGPALGLMGTLIPLAPGLAALGKGDFATLAGDLQVAFAATVIGILVGTASFAMTLVRTRVYTEDLAALERAVSVGMPQAPEHHRVPAAVGEHDA
ncbi:MotA/TolQ/ExbB proton channel family protein [Patulibacter sp. S7RM1-6]